MRVSTEVSILSRLADRLQPDAALNTIGGILFQSSAGSLTGCNWRERGCAQVVELVSILSRLADRLQLAPGRTLPTARKRFQSSAGSLTGCNCAGGAGGVGSAVFQSSAGSPTGCNFVRPAATRWMTLFQSSAGSLTGCNHDGARLDEGIFVFQSSAGSLTGCNLAPAESDAGVGQVSILSRLADRLQPARTCPGLPTDSRFNPQPAR